MEIVLQGEIRLAREEWEAWQKTRPHPAAPGSKPEEGPSFASRRNGPKQARRRLV
jgi:hypothetical protein